MTQAFDFRNPDYVPLLQERLRRLQWIRENPDQVPALLAFYRERPWMLIHDWGMTYDPRNADLDLPTKIPFVLMPKQREWCEWVVRMWRGRTPGLTEKSRDCGVSWLAVALSASICLTQQGVNIGFGSRKEEYVDKKGAPKSLFWKAREFIKMLPPEFTGGWSEKHNSVHMLITFPTGSTMTGEAGDSIGRGDRAAIYFVDEAAHLERPHLVDQGLSATTNCRIDISSANGTANPFYEKRNRYPADQVFTFHWRDDPRKDQAWYDKQAEDLDPVTLAQEVDINYSAAQTGIVIPSEWVQAAVDADKVLGMQATGARRGALDVADEGIDMNAFGWRQGVLVEGVEEWSGKGSDLFDTAKRAFGICDDHGLESFDNDADGLGAGIRGDARVINGERQAAGVRTVTVSPFRGSGAVHKPDAPIPTADPGTAARGRLDRTNGDYFLNAKAQGWWELRVRFQRTARAVALHKAREAHGYHADDLIFLRSGMPGFAKVVRDLSQPTYSQTTAGKIVVDKAPNGSRSPNCGDVVMILFAPRSTSFLAAIRQRG